MITRSRRASSISQRDVWLMMGVSFGAGRRSMVGCDVLVDRVSDAVVAS